MNDNQKHLGGTYLKTGHIKPARDGTPQRVRCAIMGRNGGPRIVPERTENGRKFGASLELPIEIEGQEFIASLPHGKGDALKLATIYGDDLASWVGKEVDIFESTLLDRIRVVVPGGS